jgi:uncharacterized SAM-binding protein YcdF (DUF218 family)
MSGAPSSEAMESRRSRPGVRKVGRWMVRSAALLVGATSLAILTVRFGLPGFGRWLAMPDSVRQVDAIVVLGGGYPRRMEHAIELYQQGVAPELWRSGDVGSCPNARAALELAVARGVPTQAVQFLATHSTWEDALKTAALAKGREVGSIIVVTDWFHSRRALCAIRQQLSGSGIAVYSSLVADPAYGPEDWWLHPYGRATVLREAAKVGGYWVRYGVNPWRCG